MRRASPLGSLMSSGTPLTSCCATASKWPRPPPPATACRWPSCSSPRALTRHRRPRRPAQRDRPAPARAPHARHPETTTVLRDRVHQARQACLVATSQRLTRVSPAPMLFFVFGPHASGNCRSPIERLQGSFCHCSAGAAHSRGHGRGVRGRSCRQAQPRSLPSCATPRLEGGRSLVRSRALDRPREERQPGELRLERRDRLRRAGLSGARSETLAFRGFRCDRCRRPSERPNVRGSTPAEQRFLRDLSQHGAWRSDSRHAVRALRQAEAP
jgi:hypothetical protein